MSTDTVNKSKEKLAYYASTWIGGTTFNATYQGHTILKIEPRTMGRTITVNTHGFHTTATARALNCAFEDSGLMYRAMTSGTHKRATKIYGMKSVHEITGDVEYIILD